MLNTCLKNALSENLRKEKNCLIVTLSEFTFDILVLKAFSSYSPNYNSQNIALIHI